MSRVISIKVKPGSGKDEIIPQPGGTFIVKLKAKPEHGAANLQLIKLLAKHLGVSVTSITILLGKTNSKKMIKID
jgi:uncharacterized protein (TIGR00251 family)